MPESHHSFDVFDTCLTRIYARPGDLFLGLGRRLKESGLWNDSPSRFMELRIAAEREARQAAAPREIRLAEIYQQLAARCCLEPETVEAMNREEIALELSALKPVPEIQSRIQGLHAAGERVIFVSEMYLPASVIQKALEAAGIWKDGDRLYVSSENGLQKGRGLFKLMLESEKIAPHAVSHTGDHPRADVEHPRAAGMEARLFTGTGLNRHEKTTRDQCASGAEEAASLIAGASRLARLEGWQRAENRAFWDVGASVAGPVLGAFVDWTLRQAEASGVERLYFIARDGQILLRLAKQLPASQRIDCRYLYGSRQAWHLPGITSLGDDDLSWILMACHGLTFERVLRRLDLSYEEVREASGGDLLLPARDQPLCGEDSQSLRPWLLSPAIKSLIERKAAETRKKALGYFAEQGLLDSEVRWGIVDIGWGGNMQRSLRRILTAENRCPAEGLVGFYYRLYGTFSAPDLGFSFLTAVTTPEKTAEVQTGGFMLELLTRADHGGTLGYAWNGTRHEPVLNHGDLENGILHGTDEQQAGAEWFMKHLVSYGADHALSAASIFEAFIDFCNHPGRDEAAAYGELAFQSDQTGALGAKWAPEVGLLGAIRHSLAGTNGKWFAAMASRANGPARLVLRSGMAARKLRRKWRR